MYLLKFWKHFSLPPFWLHALPISPYLRLSWIFGQVFNFIQSKTVPINSKGLGSIWQMGRKAWNILWCSSPFDFPCAFCRQQPSSLELQVAANLHPLCRSKIQLKCNIAVCLFLSGHSYFAFLLQKYPVDQTHKRNVLFHYINHVYLSG